MVNLFRKYQQGLMIIITILVIIAFAWLYNGTRFEKIGAGVVAKIYNRNLLQADVDRIARKFSLSYQLGLVDLAQDLGGGRTQSESLENFVWNSLVLQHEAERLQIEPTDDEVFASLKTLPAFQTNGAFDPQKYATILQDALAPRGFTQEQLELMVREDLRLKKSRRSSARPSRFRPPSSAPYTRSRTRKWKSPSCASISPIFPPRFR